MLGKLLCLIVLLRYKVEDYIMVYVVMIMLEKEGVGWEVKFLFYRLNDLMVKVVNGWGEGD